MVILRKEQREAGIKQVLSKRGFDDLGALTTVVVRLGRNRPQRVDYINHFE